MKTFSRNILIISISHSLKIQPSEKHFTTHGFPVFIPTSQISSNWFFFSSRRQHTSWNCDWSSDVCSSDLGRVDQVLTGAGDAVGPAKLAGEFACLAELAQDVAVQVQLVEAPRKTVSTPDHLFGAGGDADAQIGRASCRERVLISVVNVPLQ